MSRVHDLRLLAGNRRRVGVVVDGGEAVAVHLEHSRWSMDELEELVQRLRDGDFEQGEDLE